MSGTGRGRGRSPSVPARHREGRGGRGLDERYMRRALVLARRGASLTSPNPLVGCVLVRGGRVVGEGWHASFGGPHAEAVALSRAGRRARGATAYVNLEPCCPNPLKKTAPCAPALVRAGVRRVVAGMSDPNPLVSGRGLGLLRRAGLRVSSGVLGRRCRALNEPFARRTARPRPYVILKAAASLDGRMATASGESKWITSPASRRLAWRMRAEADAVLVGSGTVLADDPSLTSHGAGRDPLRVVLDSRLRIPARARVLDGRAPTLVATASRGRTRRPNVQVLCIPRRRGGLDLRLLLRSLAGMGIGTLLVEGGAQVQTSFLEQGLADEIRLFLAPRLIGGKGAPTFFGGRGTRRLAEAPRLKRLSIRRVGTDLLLTGYL